MKKALLAFLLLVTPLAPPVHAQQTFGLTPTFSKTLSVTTATGNVQLGAGTGTTVVVWNGGANAAFVAVGTTSAAAATVAGSMYLPPGSCVVLNAQPSWYLAAITGSSTTTLYITQGAGQTACSFGGVGAAGGSSIAVNDDQGPDASGTFTNATQTTSVTSVDIDGYGTVTVSINGTYGTASAQFEQSDDGATTWYPVLCSQEGAGILETGYSQLTNTNRMWRCGISGADHFRVRSTAVASGTVNVLASFSGMPTTNGATVSVAPTLDLGGTGTLTIVDSGSSTTTGQSGASIVTGTATAGSTAAIALNGRATITVQLAGTWVGTLSLEASTDGGTTWEPYGAHVKGAATQVSAPTGNGVFLANVSGVTNYRVRWTARTSGSVNVTFVGSVETGVIYVANALRILGLDGVSQATVKAASTTPLTTDTALVAGIADGFNVTQGAIADAAATAGSTGTLSAKLRLITTQLATTATNQTATQAPVAPATATATKSDLIGCQATSAAVSPTTGQQGAVPCDLNQNILVSAGGAPNLATAQVSVTTGNISVAALRALRRAVTITNVTGTSAIYCGNTGVSTSTGTYLGSTAGSSITLNTTAAVFCTVAATTQTVTVVETY